VYRTGDIVCISYGDFNGETRVGIFLIVYNEKQDRHYTSSHSNILCAKITTNSFQGDGYTARLKKGEANLQEDCLVSLSKLHTFTNERAYKLIGRLEPYRMSQIFKEYHKFNQEIENQLMELF
jgi:mRNA-degrading endonuclease toxin of MazEF toxin-antitoxin module